jgi:uncharacterized protein (DUF433 family)
MNSQIFQKVIEQVDQLDLDEQLDLMIYLATKTNKKLTNTEPIIKGLISQNPDILGGEPCIKGTRISVQLILENLAAGRSKEQLCYSYPSLSPEAIEAAIAYGKSLESNHYLRKLAEEYCAIFSR